MGFMTVRHRLPCDVLWHKHEGLADEALLLRPRPPGNAAVRTSRLSGSPPPRRLRFAKSHCRSKPTFILQKAALKSHISPKACLEGNPRYPQYSLSLASRSESIQETVKCVCGITHGCSLTTCALYRLLAVISLYPDNPVRMEVSPILQRGAGLRLRENEIYLHEITELSKQQGWKQELCDTKPAPCATQHKLKPTTGGRACGTRQWLCEP